MYRHRNGRGHFVERRNFYPKITRLNTVGTRCRIRSDLLGQKFYLESYRRFSIRTPTGNAYVFDCVSRYSFLYYPNPHGCIMCVHSFLIDYQIFVTLKQCKFRVTVFYSNLHRDNMLRNRTLCARMYVKRIQQ